LIALLQVMVKRVNQLISEPCAPVFWRDIYSLKIDQFGLACVYGHQGHVDPGSSGNSAIVRLRYANNVF